MTSFDVANIDSSMWHVCRKVAVTMECALRSPAISHLKCDRRSVVPLRDMKIDFNTRVATELRNKRRY